MQIASARIQRIGIGLSGPASLVAIFRTLISLEEFDEINTDVERIALIDQIIAAISEARG